MTCTNAQIRQAILSAAEHIEAHPEQFDFNRSFKPRCGSPGCALGWIGFHLSLEEDFSEDYCDTVAVALGWEWKLPDQDFYESLDELTGGTAWMDDSKKCAHALRLYAAWHHPDLSCFLVGDMPEGVEHG